MDIFSIDLAHNEIIFIRQCLDLPSISGKDAKFLANLQTRIENELMHIDQMKQAEAQKKTEELQATLDRENQKINK